MFQTQYDSQKGITEYFGGVTYKNAKRRLRSAVGSRVLKRLGPQDVAGTATSATTLATVGGARSS